LNIPAVPGWQQFVDLLKFSLVEINHLVGNPGLAIIIFTLIVKILTFPLILKSFRSMREMQRIQPLIKEVNKQYKDDKAKQQSEMMRIYQVHGVNPAGSCLPMIIQMPIMLALYSALNDLVRNNHDFTTPFLWVGTLAIADPFHIWPVLSGIVQFLSNRMAQAYGSNKNTDPQTAMMNRIMQFLPLYLIVIYLNLPAGMVIYWTFSALFSAMQTYFINGFGTLPDVPGFSWLPRRPLPAPTADILEEMAAVDAQADADKAPRKSPSTAAAYRLATNRAEVSGSTSSIGSTPGKRKSFMEKMMEQAIAAQEAQQAAAAARAAQNGNGAETRLLGPAEGPAPAEDDATRHLTTINGNGAESDLPTGSTLPRKRKNKR